MQAHRWIMLGAVALLAPPELRAQPRPPDDGRAPVEWPSHECRSLRRAIDALPDSRPWIEARPLELPESFSVRVPRIVTGGAGSRELPGTSSPEVHAISADLEASPEPASVALSIAPPLWRQWRLPTGVVILGVLGAYALHRVRLARLLELERVRMRIATDLHDDIGASLTQIAILTEVAQRQMTVLDPAVVEPIARVSSISRELVDSMSEIVWAINPRHDRLSDLAARMRRFASDVLTCRHIALAFHAPDHVLDVPMGADHRRQCFLVFKEAIHNTVRHAACTEVVVEIARAGRSLVISVGDDGAGFDPRQASQGHGICSMQARAHTIGGRLEIVSRPGGGTTVRFIVPLHHRGFLDARPPRSLRPTRITNPVSVDGPLAAPP